MDTKKNGKIASLIISLLILVLSAVPGIDWESVGIYGGCDLQNRLLYPFFHANFFHALINVWCLLTIAFMYDASAWRLFMAYIISVSVPVDLMTSMGISVGHPTVGLSGAIYVLLGMLTFSVKRRIVYLSWIVFYILIGFLFPRTNAWIHLYCFIIGVFIALLGKPIKWRRRRDVQRD